MQTFKKTLTFSQSGFKFKSDEGTFTGYGSVFGNQDSDGDIIVKGAYDSVIESGIMPKMFFNHDSWSVPIGAWKSIEADDHGLLLTGKLNDSPSGHEIKAALDNGALDGLSVGFGYTSDDMEVKDGVTHIKNIPKLHEVSVVTFPANDQATVDLSSVKSKLDNLVTLKDFSSFLRNTGGYSRGTVELLIPRLKAILAGDSAQVDDESAARVLKMLGSLKS